MTMTTIVLLLTLVSMIAYRFFGDKIADIFESKEKTLGRISKKDKIKLWMMVVVTLIVLPCSLYVILFGDYDDGTKKWAFGVVGSLIGFWLK